MATGVCVGLWGLWGMAGDGSGRPWLFIAQPGVVRCELEVPHPPHYEQLPSCLLARPGWGARGQEGRERGSGRGEGISPL